VRTSSAFVPMQRAVVLLSICNILTRRACMKHHSSYQHWYILPNMKQRPLQRITQKWFIESHSGWGISVKCEPHMFGTYEGSTLREISIRNSAVSVLDTEKKTFSRICRMHLWPSLNFRWQTSAFRSLNAGYKSHVVWAHAAFHHLNTRVVDSNPALDVYVYPRYLCVALCIYSPHGPIPHLRSPTNV
jgi:hypothetical protein